ncbi:hypothetical protein JS530_01935 [Bifidobacterium sp. LC6]|uniref:Uncharacterized protein n=1 Tax=Bifidobacterium colobi TaxID=2809026 RepID=A0ABS5UU31_9BIFI|nr:hypothetical protein [Bifidobacterium colobi]MBT1174281.1 hypothetical protein [Bifidobacterium colobi]
MTHRLLIELESRNEKNAVWEKATVLRTSIFCRFSEDEFETMLTSIGFTEIESTYDETRDYYDHNTYTGYSGDYKRLLEQLNPELSALLPPPPKDDAFADATITIKIYW